jgi:hypothetical protein
MVKGRTYNILYQILPLIIVSVLIDVYVLRNSINISIVQSADWPIPILNLKSLSYFFFPAWSFQDMAPNGMNVFLMVYGFFSSISHNPSLIQKLFYYLPWALSPFSAFVLLRYIGLKGKLLIFFSLLYQFGPWITGQFMDGEPVNVALYLFIPLVLYVTLRFRNKPLALFMWLTAVMAIPSFFTLEAPFFYIFLMLPVILFELSDDAIKNSLKLLASMAASFLAVILFNIYSIIPYITAFSEVSSSGSPFISSFTQFPPAVAARYWMLAFILTLIPILIFIYYTNSAKFRKFFVFLFATSVFLLIIYPGLGDSNLGIFLLEHVPFFAPFINPLEFLLFIWLGLFVTTAYSTYLFKKEWRPAFHLHRTKKRFFLNNKFVFSLLCIGISLLLISSTFVEIQSFGSNDTGRYLFTDGTHFDQTQIQPQYSKLNDYLGSHNGSFGLSYHTIIFPENPSSTLPFYIGQQMIPGYIGLFNKNISQQVLNGLTGNNSNFLMTLSIMGIRYLAVMDIPSSSWSGSNGSPELSMWGPNYIFVGNYSLYLNDLRNLSGLNLVLNENGLWVFENTYYESPIIASNPIYLNDLQRGDYHSMCNLTPISKNLAYASNYYYSGQNYSLTGKLNFTISKSNSSVHAYTFVYLKPNSTYVFSFNFDTNGTLPTFYGNGQNAGCAFFNVTPSSQNIVGVSVISLNPENHANGTYSSVFKTPGERNPISTKLVFQLQPPKNHKKIHVNITGVSLYMVNGTNMFFKYILPIHYSSIGSTTILLKNIPNSYEVSIDQSYGKGWHFEAGAVKGRVSMNSFGLLGFVGDGSSNIIVHYTNQNVYTNLLYISFGSIFLFSVLFSFWVTLPKFIAIKRKTKA